MGPLSVRNLQTLLTRKRRFCLEGIWQCGITTQTQDDMKITNSGIYTEDKSSQKLLKVAVIGMPNAGKSTFVNFLIDRDVCATSSKVHTTRTIAKAIFTEGNSQIIFIDTPGLVADHAAKRYNLENNFVSGSNVGLHYADVIGVIHDVSNEFTREKLDTKVVNLLKSNISKPSFLVLNKVDDLFTKRALSECTRLLTMNCLDGKPMYAKSNRRLQESEYCGWPHFKEIFMVSSLRGDGMDKVKTYLLNNAKPGDWEYPSDVYSDQTPEEIIIKTVKAVLLNYLQQEIPYQTVPTLEFYEVTEEGTINAMVIVQCPTKRVVKLIAGDQCGRLKQITLSTQNVLQNAFQKYVKVQIILDVPFKD